MKLQVTDACIGCGLCASACPEVFHMTDSGLAEAIEDDVPTEAEAAADSAKAGCPVAAIVEAE